MARIAGVDLPKNKKRGEIGLTYIYGIGRSTANMILSETQPVVLGREWVLIDADFSDRFLGEGNGPR